ncbi:MAG: hypothetical protein JNM68_17350 [Dinghuibacter sp.]|nr:hypothetical protein [Dinghuibacter sp.]
MKLIPVLLIVCLASCRLQSHVQVNAAYIKTVPPQNGITIAKLQVFHRDARGVPDSFRADSVFRACSARALPYHETITRLPPVAAQEYAQVSRLLDSIRRAHPSGNFPNEWHQAQHRIEQLKAWYIKIKRVRRFYFRQNTRWYTWKTAKGNAHNPEGDCTGFRLQPLVWYTATVAARYGLLTSGTRTIYFMLNGQGRLEQYIIDKKNEAAF